MQRNQHALIASCRENTSTKQRFEAAPAEKATIKNFEQPSRGRIHKLAQTSNILLAIMNAITVLTDP